MTPTASTVPVLGTYKAQKLWRLRRARNAPSTIVDATPAQDHVCWLVSLGFNDSSIAAAAGLTQKTVANYRLRVYPTARAQHAQRLLQVSHVPCPAQADRYVPSLGAQRRIRALLAIGWRYSDIAEASGLHYVATIGRVMRVTVIQGRTWEAIHRAYERLSGRPGPSTIGQKKAINQGFASPMAWEDIDIDHPDAVPAMDSPDTEAGVDEVLLARLITGQHTAPAGTIPAAEREAFLDHAVAHGWTGTQVAEALQIDRKAGDHLLRRRKRKLAEEAAA
ncbi:hypothetical protein [Nocardia thailandica]|uniref:hypothetical protein n=1 Tax=Nocardia thailandica TaxID=257275 RepID=UPI0005B9BD74|nr:hypothetical protein [Nocardia thailandica]